MPDRIKVLNPNVALTPVEITTDEVDISVYGEIGVEIFPENTVGGIQVVLELSPDGDAFFPEPIEDTASGTPVGNDMLVPIYRQVRTWADATAPIAFFTAVAGYKKVRLKVSVGTSGGAMIFINKLRLATN